MPIDIVPVIMAGIIAIYGLVVSVLISADLQQQLPLYTSFIQLGAGLSVGLAGLAAGYVLLFPTLLRSSLDSSSCFPLTSPSIILPPLRPFLSA